MGRKFVNTGPKAGQVGLPEGRRWRCPACTLMVRFEANQCPRCTEMVNDDEKGALEVKSSSVQKKHIPYHLAKPTASRKDGPKVEVKVPKKKRTPTTNKLKSNTTKSKPRSKSTFSVNSRAKPKARAVRGFDSKGRTRNVRNDKKKPAKKLGTPVHKQDPKKLGYKPSRQGNAKTFVRSKLNHDTASYRGKFEHTQKKLGGKRMNIATLEHIVSKQGFNTAVKKMKKGWDSHDDRPVTPPPKKGKRKGKSWITALQNASSTGAVASLRHKERYHNARHVDIDGKKSKFAL